MSKFANVVKRAHTMLDAYEKAGQMDTEEAFQARAVITMEAEIEKLLEENRKLKGKSNA